MILDTSAILAILFEEPDGELFADAMANAERCRMSAANYLEAAIVAEGHAQAGDIRQFDALVRNAGIIIEPVTEEHAYVARQGWLDFGKGRHPAGLNFGDCFAYALAKVSGEPLLFKGDDFRKTDLTAAL